MIEKPPIYLDYHATTPLDPAVGDAMQPWWEEGFGNPHSGDHWFGWQAHQAVEAARDNIATLIRAEASEIVFTSGATEANNIALLGAARGRIAERRRIIVSTIEHKCVLEAASALSQDGWRVDAVPVDHDGFVDVGALKAMLCDDTALVSVMAVNNEIGTIQPIKTVGELCSNVGAWFHCDAAQAPAAMRIDVFDSHVDLLSLSSHKMYGPKGVGALFARGDVLPRLRPIMYGGGQEQGIRSGTLPTPLCVGFGRACTLMRERWRTDRDRVDALRKRMWAGIEQEMPSVRLNGPVVERHPGNLNVCFEGYDAHMLLGRLQTETRGLNGIGLYNWNFRTLPCAHRDRLAVARRRKFNSLWYRASHNRRRHR